MEKNMSGCEKEKCGGLRKGEIGRRERGTFCPRCAVDFFAARGALPTFAVRVVLSTFLPSALRCRLFCRPHCPEDCLEGCHQTGKKYKAHDPELAAVRDVS